MHEHHDVVLRRRSAARRLPQRVTDRLIKVVGRHGSEFADGEAVLRRRPRLLLQGRQFAVRLVHQDVGSRRPISQLADLVAEPRRIRATGFTILRFVAKLMRIVRGGVHGTACIWPSGPPGSDRPSHLRRLRHREHLGVLTPFELRHFAAPASIPARGPSSLPCPSRVAVHFARHFDHAFLRLHLFHRLGHHCLPVTRATLSTLIISAGVQMRSIGLPSCSTRT